MSGHGVRRRTMGALLGVGVAVAASAGLALADPAADFAVSAERPVPGETVTFTAQAACAAPVECTWDFGDGNGAAGREVGHAFAAAGPQTVTLTVSDPGDRGRPVRGHGGRAGRRPSLGGVLRRPRDPAQARHRDLRRAGLVRSRRGRARLPVGLRRRRRAGRRGSGDHPLLPRGRQPTRPRSPWTTACSSTSRSPRSRCAPCRRPPRSRPPPRPR